MSEPSFGNCDKATTDTQLFINNMAGLLNSTFKFECFAGRDIEDQNGPAFSSCGSDVPNLCIGGNKGQHACGASTCQFIDWTKSSARACPAAILQYAQVQPKGVVAPCCDSTGCSAPRPEQRAVYVRHLAHAVSLCERRRGGGVRGAQGEHDLLWEFLGCGERAQWNLCGGSVADWVKWKWK